MAPETPEPPRWSAVKRRGVWAIACAGRVLALQASEEEARTLADLLNAREARHGRRTPEKKDAMIGGSGNVGGA